MDERIHTMETQAADREGNKEVALGTSKIVSNGAAWAEMVLAMLTWDAELH